MADDLVKDWEKLKLTEDENRTLVGVENDGEDELSKSRMEISLVGKLLTNKPYNLEAMKRVLKGLLRLCDNVAIRKIDTNLLIFQFFNGEDKRRVLDGRPWVFDQKLLVVQNIDAVEQPSSIVFNQSPFWIRLLDVPFGCRNAKFAQEIGEHVGNFLECDQSEPLGWDEFMRVKVMVDITKPLRRGVKIDVGHSSPKWVGFKYERLGIFCYYCGGLGHIDKDCFEQDLVNINEDFVFQYGPFLVALPLQRSKATLVEREEERKWVDALFTRRMPRRISYNDPKAVKLGPPGAARKLFSSSMSPKSREAKG